jgi:hypothetical protein
VAQTTPVLPYRSSRRRRARDRPTQPIQQSQLHFSGGRAWINGREVGGPDPRFAHLDRSYD